MEPSCQLLGPAASVEADGEVQPPPTERGCVLLLTRSVGQRDGFERCLELLLGTSWDGDLDEVRDGGEGCAVGTHPGASAAGADWQGQSGGVWAGRRRSSGGRRADDGGEGRECILWRIGVGRIQGDVMQ